VPLKNEERQSACSRRSAAPRAFSSKLSVTNGDVALEMVNDRPSRSCVIGLACRISVRGAYGRVRSSVRSCGAIIPMAHSTRQLRTFPADTDVKKLCGESFYDASARSLSPDHNRHSEVNVRLGLLVLHAIAYCNACRQRRRV
jgi:hypothetical protein